MNKSRAGRTTPASAAGFTLVEVLVTIVVLAIGILGLAGLQIAGMRSNHSAYLRTQATLAAMDLADRMRVDPTNFVGISLSSDGKTGVATFDRWAAALADVLPASKKGALASVNCDAADNDCNSGNCEIVVRWDDARVEDDALTQDGRDAAALEFRLCTRLPEG